MKNTLIHDVIPVTASFISWLWLPLVNPIFIQWSLLRNLTSTFTYWCPNCYTMYVFIITKSTTSFIKRLKHSWKSIPVTCQYTHSNKSAWNMPFLLILKTHLSLILSWFFLISTSLTSLYFPHKLVVTIWCIR
jgi:hypothetical protein